MFGKRELERAERIGEKQQKSGQSLVSFLHNAEDICVANPFVDTTARFCLTYEQSCRTYGKDNVDSFIRRANIITMMEDYLQAEPSYEFISVTDNSVKVRCGRDVFFFDISEHGRIFCNGADCVDNWESSLPEEEKDTVRLFREKYYERFNEVSNPFSLDEMKRANIVARMNDDLVSSEQLVRFYDDENEESITDPFCDVHGNSLTYEEAVRYYGKRLVEGFVKDACDLTYLLEVLAGSGTFEISNVSDGNFLVWFEDEGEFDSSMHREGNYIIGENRTYMISQSLSRFPYGGDNNMVRCYLSCYDIVCPDKKETEECKEKTKGNNDMNFWETLPGKQFASILQSSLPDIAEGLAKKKQYAVKVMRDNAFETITEEIKNGSHLDHSILVNNVEIVLVFSR